MWFLVIVAVAMYFAAKAGIPAAGRAIGEAWHNRGKNGRIWAEKRAARKQLTSDAVDSGMAPVSTKVGSATGIATGAVITGGRLAFAAFLRSWKEGWREGRARAEARRVDSAGEDDSNEEVPATKRLCTECGQDVRVTEGVRGLGLCAACTATRFADREEEESAPNDDPVLRGGGCSCPDHAIACDNPPVAGSSLCAGCKPAAPKEDTTTRGARLMPVETTGTGEIVTYDQFIAELDAARTEARAEIEEAKVQEKVAKENLQRAEMMANALTRLNLPKEVVDAVKKTKDSLGSQVKACEARIAAAELAVAQLSIAMTAATNNPQQQFYRG